MSFLPNDVYKRNDIEIKNSTINIDENFEFELVVSYKYASLSESQFCFNCSDIEHVQFSNYFLRLNELCWHTYNQIEETPHYNFHSININERLGRGFFRKLREHAAKFGTDPYADQFPQLWQLGIYTSSDNDPKGAPRIVGFIGDDGIFYVIFFVLYHNIYP